MTTDLELKYFDKINYIDSPGFNDPDKFRSDEMIFQAIVETVLNKAACFGLSSVLQCVMVPESGRINKTAFQLMSKMIQVFTLSYPDSNHIGPKF